MTKYITVAALLAAGTAFANAATEIKYDIAPANSNWQSELDSAGITTADIYAAEIGKWLGTWEGVNLANQVSFSDKAVSLQIGAAASNNSGGNYAGVKFDMSDAVTAATLDFTITKTSSWGGSLASFESLYTFSVYGFSATGEATSLGSQTLTKVEEWTNGTSESVSIQLSLLADVTYSSYGVIFHAMETSTLGSAAGVATNISPITVTATAVPEPSAFGLLAGIGALALVASRRRRK